VERALPDFPRSADGDIAADAVQGVAHDDTHWYLVSTRSIWKIPLGESLQSARVQGVTPFAGRYVHLGDADYRRGVLYVPLEGDRRGGPPAIGALRSDLTPIGVQPLNGAEFASWCAVDAAGLELYTSSFDADRIQIFRIELSADHFALVFVRDLVLTRAPSEARREEAFGVVPSIQGGALSTEGELYLSSDNPGTGILVFDASSGVFLRHIPVDYEPKFGPLTNQELEGIDLFDVAGVGVPSIGGTLHALLHEELPKRRYTMKHWGKP
jgi:hypothetical protein